MYTPVAFLSPLPMMGFVNGILVNTSDPAPPVNQQYSFDKSTPFSSSRFPQPWSEAVAVNLSICQRATRLGSDSSAPISQ